MKKIKYSTSAISHVEKIIEVDDDADDLEIYLSIISDLERNHGLRIEYKKLDDKETNF